MKQLLYLFCFLVATITQAQGFYDLNTIQNIEITFAQSNWDQLLDAEKAGADGYIMAQSASINGQVFDSVGVKYKGNSTYNPNQVKNPFHIELDTYKDHKYEAYTDIKLSNVDKDPSFLREVLSYQILRQYMDAPLSNYANVSVNGTLIGLYSNSESVSKKFVDSRFYSKDNTFIKCNPPGGAGPGSNASPNLVYLGNDSLEYYDAYELNSDYGWAELIHLCDTLANQTDAIEQILDVDRALWMLAFDNILVNLDSYIGGFAQNYYLYRDDYRRFLPVVWDLNESFGRFSSTGSGNLNNTQSKQQLSPLLNATNANYPLIQKLLANPMYKRMYFAHCKTMLLENFDNGTYLSTGQALQTTISAAVQADPNKFFTYANFISNLTTDIGGGPGPGGGATPGITNLMNGRNSYLLGLTEFTQTAPTIDGITLSNPNPIINQTISITANITDANNAYLGHRSAFGAPFTRIQMFDDGAHNDGAANDNVYGVDLLVTKAFVQYYIYAENNNAGKFSPQRAEHEYHAFTATTTNPIPNGLVINEFMASNASTIVDPNGEYEDWIEFYNNSDSGIDLTGYFMSDDPNQLLKWVFPVGTFIGAHSYLVVWADNDDTQPGLHANFKLSASAETIFLISSSGMIADEVSYISQTPDISYGRYPNGIGSFQTMNPTFGAENMVTSATLNSKLDKFEVQAIPNPAGEFFYLKIRESNQQEHAVSIFSLNGQLVYQNSVFGNTRIDASDWAPGMYLVRVDGTYLKVVIQ